MAFDGSYTMAAMCVHKRGKSTRDEDLFRS